MPELPQFDIDRDSPIPFYFQLALLLENEIFAGRWVPGEQLASEPTIGNRYSLSRATVRQALQLLEEKGLILREKGRGTFVAESSSPAWSLQFSGGLYQEEMTRYGLKVSSQVLRIEEGSLPSWATRALQIAEGTEGVTLERLRWVDGRVALYVVNHLPARFTQAVMTLEAETGSLYERLEELDSIRVAGGRRTVESVTAEDRLASLLEVAQGSPLAFIESVSWDEARHPFDCYRAWLRTDRLRLEVEVARPPRGPPSDPVVRV